MFKFKHRLSMGTMHHPNYTNKRSVPEATLLGKGCAYYKVDDWHKGWFFVSIELFYYLMSLVSTL